MAEKDVKQMARESLGYSHLPIMYITTAGAIQRLSESSLLHDPAEVARGKEALEACVQHALGTDYRCSAIGRAELERRKPKVRWRVYDAGNTMGGGFRWALLDGPDHDAAAVAYFLRQSEADAEAARRNAERAS